jgi:hypothetical protein
MFRKVETPVYTNVYSSSKGIFGVVEYNTHAQLRDVMYSLRDVEFKNPFCEPTRVHLTDDTNYEDRDREDRDRSISPRDGDDRRSLSHDNDDYRSRSRSRD